MKCLYLLPVVHFNTSLRDVPFFFFYTCQFWLVTWNIPTVLDKRIENFALYPVFSQQDNLWQDPLVPPPHQDEMLVLSCHNSVLSHGERNDMGQSFFPSKEYWMTGPGFESHNFCLEQFFIFRSMFVKFSSYSQIFLEQLSGEISWSLFLTVVYFNNFLFTFACSHDDFHSTSIIFLIASNTENGNAGFGWEWVWECKSSDEAGDTLHSRSVFSTGIVLYYVKLLGLSVFIYFFTLTYLYGETK